jgi:hypothetical protein
MLGAAQRRAASVAPPVYRPQPPPKILQGKMAHGEAKSERPPLKRQTPMAPPAYRPQGVPKVLQTKTNGNRQPQKAQQKAQPAQRPETPPVYRPQAKPKLLQPKMSPAPPPRSQSQPTVAPRITLSRTIQLAEQKTEEKAEEQIYLGPQRPTSAWGAKVVSSAPKLTSYTKDELSGGLQGTGVWGKAETLFESGKDIDNSDLKYIRAKETIEKEHNPLNTKSYVTFFYELTINKGYEPIEIGANVHYEFENNAYTKGPGHYWFPERKNWQKKTPQWLVDKAPASPKQI